MAELAGFTEEAGQISGLIGFASAKKGYAYALAQYKPAYSGLATDLKYFPLITDDGGASWYHVKVPAPKGFSGALLSVGSAGLSGADSVAIPVAGWTPPINQPKGRYCGTYHTVDGGAQWSLAQAPKGICPTAFFNA